MSRRTRRKSNLRKRKTKRSKRRKIGKRSKLCNCKVCGCKKTCKCRSLQKGGYWSFNPSNWGKKKPVAEVELGPVGEEPVQLEVVEPVQGTASKPETVVDADVAQKAMTDMAINAQQQAAAGVAAGVAGVAALLGEGDSDKKEDGKLEYVPGSEIVGGRRRRSTKKKKKKKKRKRKKKTKKKKRRRKRGMAGVLTPGGQHVPTKAGFGIFVDSPNTPQNPLSIHNKAPMPGGSRRTRR